MEGIHEGQAGGTEGSLWCHIPWGVSWLRGHPQTGENWCSRVLVKILETQTGKKGNFGRFGTMNRGREKGPTCAPRSLEGPGERE